jgi:hypothetical protein
VFFVLQAYSVGCNYIAPLLIGFDRRVMEVSEQSTLFPFARRFV